MFRSLLRLVAVLAFGLALLLTGAALATQYYYQEPFLRTWSRALGPELAWQRAKYPSMDWAFAIPAALMTEDDRSRFMSVPEAGDVPPLAAHVGPRAVTGPVPARYTADGIPLPVLRVPENQDAPEGVIDSLPSQSPVPVASEAELVAAMQKARPGDHILILPGEYTITRSLYANVDGTPRQPIFVRAAQPGQVNIRFGTGEGFVLRGAYWVIENLSMEGVCKMDQWCEHALHVVEGARGTIIRNNSMRNFNAPIKVNLSGNRARTPDHGLIEGNWFANDRPRQTTQPVTLIDIVGADGWRISSNFIADFAKEGGDHTSYAAFIKGASRGGVFERNLVMCEWKHRGGVRLGLSLGGGGTTDYACRDKRCAVENDGGIIRNNIILNCPNDVGIYLNKAAGAVVHNNLVAGTIGVDVRYPETDAYIFNNIIDGRVRERDGGTATLEANLLSRWRAALLQKVSRQVFETSVRGDLAVGDAGAIAGKGKSLPSGLTDFCGRLHDPVRPDIGPFSLGKGAPCLPTGAGR